MRLEKLTSNRALDHDGLTCLYYTSLCSAAPRAERLADQVGRSASELKLNLNGTDPEAIG